MKKRLSYFNTAGFVALTIVGVLLIVFSAPVKQGVSNGIDICLNTVIPSMFPFMCLGQIAINCISDEYVPKFIEKAFFYTFGLPKQAIKTVIIGLCGGYPTGSFVASTQFEKGELSAAQAKKIMLFSLNSGPAFSILAVGENMCHSKVLGLFVFISSTLSCIITGIILGAIGKNSETLEAKPAEFKKDSLSQEFTQSVEKSVGASLKMCGWIMIFSAALSLAENPGIPESVKTILDAVSEVTVGCIKNSNSPVILAAVISWGGICVHCQIKGFMNNVNIKAYEVVLVRAAAAGISAFIMWIMLNIFPQVKSAAAIKNYTVTPTYSGVGITMCLIVLMIIFILDRKVTLGFNKNR